jgi:hypothetical protein
MGDFMMKKEPKAKPKKKGEQLKNMLNAMANN